MFPEAKPSFSVAVGKLNEAELDGKLHQVELGKPPCSSHVNKAENMVHVWSDINKRKSRSETTEVRVLEAEWEMKHQEVGFF